MRGGARLEVIAREARLPSREASPPRVAREGGTGAWPVGAPEGTRAVEHAAERREEALLRRRGERPRELHLLVPLPRVAEQQHRRERGVQLAREQHELDPAAEPQPPRERGAVPRVGDEGLGALAAERVRRALEVAQERHEPRPHRDDLRPAIARAPGREERELARPERQLVLPQLGVRAARHDGPCVRREPGVQAEPLGERPRVLLGRPIEPVAVRVDDPLELELGPALQLVHASGEVARRPVGGGRRDGAGIRDEVRQDRSLARAEQRAAALGRMAAEVRVDRAEHPVDQEHGAAPRSGEDRRGHLGEHAILALLHLVADDDAPARGHVHPAARLPRLGRTLATLGEHHVADSVENGLCHRCLLGLREMRARTENAHRAGKR